MILVVFYLAMLVSCARMFIRALAGKTTPRRRRR